MLFPHAKSHTPTKIQVFTQARGNLDEFDQLDRRAG